jgi:hypothetical protein
VAALIPVPTGRKPARVPQALRDGEQRFLQSGIKLPVAQPAMRQHAVSLICTIRILKIAV